MRQIDRSIAAIRKMAARGQLTNPQDEYHWYTASNDCVFLHTRTASDDQATPDMVAAFESQDAADAAVVALNRARPFEWPLLSALARNVARQLTA